MSAPARVRDTSTALDEIVLEVDVAAPVERTWAAAVDWNRQGEWMLGTQVSGTAQDGVGVGGGIRAVTGFGPFRVVDTMDITGWTRRTRRTSGTPGGSSAAPVPSRCGSGRAARRSSGPSSSTCRSARSAGSASGWSGRRFGWGLRRSLRSFAAWAERHPG